jgi:hypothetical protein
MSLLNHLRWGSNARHARRQSRSVVRAVERTQQLFFRSELCSALQQQHRLAAGHVHAAHAAIAFAKTERDSGERAAKKHEQKEQRCESRFHHYSGTLMKTTNKSQQIFRRTNILNFPGKVYARKFTQLSAR